MADFDRAHLQALGFQGFTALKKLPPGCPQVPANPGVYAVVRRPRSPVRFLDRSTGGFFKGKDPAVSSERLREKWVADAETIYLGKSDNLRRRLNEFARFGRGEAVGHYGGRFIWQLADNPALLSCWLVDSDPGAREAKLIGDFVAAFGLLPFANLNRPRVGSR